MTRAQLVQRLARENPGLAPDEIERLVAVFFDSVSAHLAKGGSVQFRGFGTFSTRARAAHAARNPSTGAKVAIASKRVPHFSAGRQVFEMLNPHGERHSENR